jgi:hypothetical protein
LSQVARCKHTLVCIFVLVTTSWLRHYATSRKVAGSSPEEVMDFFQFYLILPAALDPGSNPDRCGGKPATNSLSIPGYKFPYSPSRPRSSGIQTQRVPEAIFPRASLKLATSACYRDLVTCRNFNFGPCPLPCLHKQRGNSV